MSFLFPGGIRMGLDLQKAGLWKRFAAWLFDAILVCVIAVGIAFLFSALFGYDEYSAALTGAYEKYESQYSVDFDITAEEYEALSAEEKQAYESATAALMSDKEAVHAYNMTVNLSLIIVSLSILIAVLLWDFCIPLFLGNGQTLGKKIFALAVMRTDCVKISTLQLLIRTLLGKFAVEIMIPVYGLLMIFLGTLNLFMLIAIAVLFIAQGICLLVTYTNSLIHDLFSCTVVVDITSQMIFDTAEDLLEYKKEQHASRVSLQR